MKKEVVAVGMSGGVDSSVSALLLKQQGYKPIGIFMKNWDEKDKHGNCLASREFEDVAFVCNKLDIPYYSIEFIREYQDQVFKHFLNDYKAGLTPNPDILCNQKIKFKAFFDKAMELGASFIATGHYCRHLEHAGRHYLAMAEDRNKDQTYFVHTIKEEILKKVLFPLGDFKKNQIKKISIQHGLRVHQKKESMGICFIGKKKLRPFLSQYIKEDPGPLRTLDGTIVGQHQGSIFYTIGQRKGLGLGGQGEPWFVVDKKDNIVFVERGAHHSALYADELWANKISWIGTPPPAPFSCLAKIRHRQPEQKCLIKAITPLLHVSFEQPQRAITPGQQIVLYHPSQGNILCLGGGTIIRKGPNYHELGKSIKDHPSV